MIIGNGQLANAFKDLENSNIVIFASGVSDSNCIEKDKFLKEEKLLTATLNKYKGKTFIYFSSCALSIEEYPKNTYYKHKLHIEEIIKNHSNNYYIFRIPQLFGDLKKHQTLINYLYDSIQNGKTFKLYNQAYRYVIEINDLLLLVENYLQFSKPCIIVDLANDYRYNVKDIVKILESLLDKKAMYELVEKYDGYYLDLKNLNNFIQEHNLNLHFGPHYLERKLKFIK